MAVKAKPKAPCAGVINWAQPAFVLLVVGFIYTVFVFINLLPQYNNLNGGAVSDSNVHKAGAAEFWVVCALFHFFFFMLLLAFFRSIVTPPGSIPQTDMWRVGNFSVTNEHEAFIKGVLKEPIGADEELDMHVVERIRVSPLVERKKDLSRRTCEKCSGRYKPDRVHHCRVCNSCVLRMDHHCPWINNCVGFYNHKFFILLLAYGVLSALTVVIAMAPRTFAVLWAPNAAGFWTTDFLVILAWTFSLLLSVALSLFLKLHISYIRKATTTIEAKEKENPNSKNVNRRNQVRYRWRVANAKFNHGPQQNMVHVLGPMWTWLLPIQPYTTEDGTYYDIRDYIGYRETFQVRRDGKSRMLGGSEPEVC